MLFKFISCFKVFFYRFSLHLIFCLVSIFLLAACSSASLQNTADIPVIDARAEQAKSQGYYTVQPGETLYFIAWRLNLDYRDIAALNDLNKPYKLTVGERLRLTGAEQTQTKKTTAPIKIIKQPIPPNQIVKVWNWPVKGKLLHGFSATTNGINIAAPRGTLIRAAANGEVVYSGAGIRGYGNLIIIQHNAEYMTAYAHSDRVFVQEGSYVKAGQAIATVGSTGSNSVFLHFEMRKAGKAINPLKYLS